MNHHGCIGGILVNNEEKLAREWAMNFSKDATTTTHEQVQAAINYILSNTKPETMAGVEWSIEEHYLAGATCNINGSERVMIVPRDGLIIDAVLDTDRVSFSSPGSLTPNGKRYKLVEDNTTNRPEVLETEEDYDNAPAGTVIADDDDFPFCKVEDTYEWVSYLGSNSSSWVAPYSKCARVLRWGWNGRPEDGKDDHR